MDPTSKAALSAILTKYASFSAEQGKDRDLILAASQRMAERKVKMDGLHAAFSAFGFVTNGEAGFHKLKEALGSDVYDQALIAGGFPPEKSSTRQPLAADSTTRRSLATTAQTVRDIVLQALQLAHPIGLRARAIRDQIERLRGVPLHEKTVGMTLYRLSQEGVVRRDGRTWFYVPQDAETKNPGAVTPGQKTIFD